MTASTADVTAPAAANAAVSDPEEISVARAERPAPRRDFSADSLEIRR